jgi:hypothetical protein
VRGRVWAMANSGDVEKGRAEEGDQVEAGKQT